MPLAKDVVLCPRHRGPNYQKNLIKRKRKAEPKPSSVVVCFSCKVPLGDHRIPVGNYIICDFCDDILTRHGYLQIQAWKRLYRDGSIQTHMWEIKDVVTGRVEY